MEVTLEISCCKFPPAHELPKYWEDNKVVSKFHLFFFKNYLLSISLNKNNNRIFFQALIKYLAEAHRGVQGFVMDEGGFPIEKASLKIKSRDVGFQTTKYGEYWRILLPGVYKLEVSIVQYMYICFIQNQEYIITNVIISYAFFQVYADGHIPKEVEFIVVEQHPTLLNITLSTAKVKH